MPLLNKRLFEPTPVPHGITRDTPIFFCSATKEVFLNHDEYFRRMVLLNSTTWSCALTRKTNLTYFEAVASEEEAERELGDFPEYLELPILYIVHKLTNRGRFEELVNDIYHVMKDRYFINEEVAYSERSRKYTARIVSSYTMVYENGEPHVAAGDVKEPVMPVAEGYVYSIEIIDKVMPTEEKFREGVTCDKLFRSKNVGARQKIRLFLKNACHMQSSGERYTIKDSYVDKLERSQITWAGIMSGPEPVCPQTPVLQRGRIPNMMKPGYVEPERKDKKPKKGERDPSAPPRPRGRPPKTPEQRAKFEEEKKTRKRREAGQETYDCDLTCSGALTLSVPSTSTPQKKPRKNSLKNEKKKAKILNQQEELEFYFTEARRLGIDVSGLQQEEKLLNGKTVAEFKQKVKEEKDAERENAKEEKRKKLREKAAYNRKREDLICNDLKPMPRFPRLELPTWMSDEEFSDYIFVMQFFCSFKTILPLKEIRGNDEILFSDIVIATRCNDPQNSPFADLMRVLISIRTDIADEEDGDEADIANKDEVYLINTQNCDPVNSTHGDSIREISDMHFRIRKIHGKSVRHLPVDWMTLTEVLRLIFETSGYYTGISTHRHRLYARGNFRGYEDPAFELRNSRPDIMEKLRTQTVFDLEPCERLEIMMVLIYQLLTYSKFRAHIEKQQSDMFDLKKEQKKLKAWFVGQEAEANAARLLLESSTATNGTANGYSAVVKKLKMHIKAHNEGRRYDKEDLENILLESVPYSSLDIDEIVTARELQRVEYNQIMDTLISRIFSIHCNVSDIRLGNDRAYRRYIVLENLSAILIEAPCSTEPLVDCEAPSCIDDELLQETDTHEVILCTGKTGTCSVHGPDRLRRSRWCYIESREQFELLIKSLNPRGLRENELLEELNEYRSSLLVMLEDTERGLEDGYWKIQLMTEDPDPADTYNIDWDTEMRDLLLDFEEKIEQGQMGSLEKIFSVSRAAWRDNLKNHGDVCMLLQENVNVANDVAIDLEESRNYPDVKKLVCAFFLIVRSINFKFIKAPFISPNRDEHGNLKPSELFIRWQKALLKCESLSALSLFISTLEGSIKWDKSRLQGKCRSCRRKAAAHELVLCAECDNCYHLKCAKLKTEEDAPTDWLCTTCRAQKRKMENEAKRLKRVDEIGDADEELSNMSLGVSSESPTKNEGECSNRIISSDTIRTSSGRAVKRVQYAEVHEGPSFKSRKSNGTSAHAATPVTPSERPVRSTAVKFFSSFAIDDGNGLSDEETSDDDRYQKKRTSMKKSATTPKPVSSEYRAPPPVNKKEQMSAIESLIKKAMQQECSWPFLQPVDLKEVPDYYDVIKSPMDLGTMMNKIKRKDYNQPVEVRNDFKLIISNCETYNETESEIFELAQELNVFVSNRLDSIIDQ